MTDSTPPPIHIYDYHDLDAIPDPEWLIGAPPGDNRGIIQRESLAVIAATKASFKTFLALDFGLSIAFGIDWLGRPVRQGNVLHIVGEGGRGIRLRARAWQHHHNLWLPKPSPWKCTVQPIDLLTRSGALFQEIIKSFHDGLELLIVDTLARNMVGDENSTSQMSELVSQVDGIKSAIGCTVLFLHHFNRGGTFRGSSSLDGAFDTVITMVRQGETTTISCQPPVGKQKDAEEFDDIKLKRKKVDLGDGKDSMVLELDDSTDPSVEALLRLISARGDSRGLTHDEALAAALEAKLFGKTKFESVWKSAKDSELIVPFDGLLQIKGTRWVRNLDAVEIAA